MSLKDKVIVITGAASGIGEETARLFASRGAKLSLADVQEERLQKLKAEILQTHPEAKIIAFTVDVSKRKEVEDWISETVATFGKLDGCANLAGVIGKQSNVVPIEGVDDDDWDFIYGVNVIGLRNCLRAQVPHINEGGAIVNASSILGLIGAPNNLAYASSKHAIVGMTRVAAKELGPRNIRCNCFCPGPVDTPMLRNSYELLGKEVDYSFLPLGRTAHQKELPATVEFLISDASSFMTGVALPVDGGMANSRPTQSITAAFARSLEGLRTMSVEKLIRITVFANRNPKLSEEEYHRHWAEKHAPLVSYWLQRHGVVKYTQYHTTTAHKSLTQQKTLLYDGTADFYVWNYEDFEKAYDDPYYKEVVQPDEEYLFDIENMRVLVGTETCVIQEGKIVEGMSQKS